MGRSLRTTALLALLLATVVPQAPARADDLAFSLPAPFGPVSPGESVAYEVSGDCTEEAVSVRALLGDGEVSVAGAPSPGCSGVVTLPTEAELAAAGIPDHEVREIVLQALEQGEKRAELPLRPKRVEAEHAEQIEGDLSVSPADDPFGGGSALDVRGPAATISLGTVDLSEVSSISVRAAGPGSAFCHPSYEGTYCRAGRALFFGGSPSGPLLTAVEIMATTPQRPWGRTVSEPLRVHPAGPVEVFVTFVEAVPGSCGGLSLPSVVIVRCPGQGPFLRVNYVEFNGSGVAEPYEFPPDPVGTTTLFDGSSLDGWTMAGTGEFFLEDDGSMRSFAGYGLLWYRAQQFADFRLRLEFKVDSPDANSGVFVRFPDPAGSALAPSDTGYEVQIQDYGQAYIASSDLSQTGAIYSFKAAERLNTRTVGDWNALEIEAVHHTYKVWLNGRLINEYTGSRQLAGHIGVQDHDPAGTAWFREIRVLPPPGS